MSNALCRGQHYCVRPKLAERRRRTYFEESEEYIYIPDWGRYLSAMDSYFFIAGRDFKEIFLGLLV